MARRYWRRTMIVREVGWVMHQQLARPKSGTYYVRVYRYNNSEGLHWV